MLDAIEKRKRIDFVYQKYVDGVYEKRTIDPYFIKEFKSRWYVIARDRKDLKIKTFALERIESEPTSICSAGCYDIPTDIKPDTFFKDSFGIFRLENQKVQEVELSFKPLKGKFIKSQPLHTSQIVIIESETELRVKLNLQITHDFVMDLLSHGDEVKVIAPADLVEEVKRKLSEALNQY
jgi:predicted DNA-binding transcriptional regulator YafY